MDDVTMETRRYPPPMTTDIPTPVAPKRPEWLVALLIVGGVVLIVAIGIGAWWLTTQRTITVAGDITVTSRADVTSTGTGCFTSGGYADIAAGAQIIIKDAAGKVLATTTLGPGVGAGICTFPFTADVPRGSDFYGVELARRGVVTFSAEQMAAGVHLSIGG
jgi:hypothetical protein